MNARILVLNSGSTSLKAGVFEPANGAGLASEQAVLTLEADGIGSPGSRLRAFDARGAVVAEDATPIGSPKDALAPLAAMLRQQGAGRLAAVAHRIVHGGPRLQRHVRLDAGVLATLRGAVHFAPLHLPAALHVVEAAEAAFPGVPQYACFDTAFHATMPEEATRLPVPAEYAAQGVRRYGFHGLSYESIVAQLRARPQPLPLRIVCAHLGGGSSLCALYRGRSIDTTMGLSPAGGVPMATRSGDLDPEVLLLLARAGRLTPDALEQMVNQHSGLTAICGTGDMQQLQDAVEKGDPDALLAFSIYTTAVAKAGAALTVSLGGLDLLVFTGGIGQHSAPVRAAVLAKLAPFGVRVDEETNRQSAPSIATPASRVPVVILPAEEDAMIAVHARKLLQGE